MGKAILLKKTFEVKKTKDGSEFGELLLIKKDKEYPTKLWNITEEQKALLNNSRLFEVEGVKESWQGKEYIRISNVTAVDESMYNIIDFVDGVDGNMYLNEIQTCLDSFKNEELKEVVKTCLERYKDRFIYNVAAEKFHHDIRGGLAYHTATILKAANAICGIYPELNKELLFSGVILHDLLKCEEIQCDDIGAEITYSTRGRLLGHIPMGVILIENVCNELGTTEGIKTILQHLVLCHHGQGEWGSPVKPLIPEGQVLHNLDKLDADLFNFFRKLNNVEPGGFTEKVFQLDNRMLFKTEI